MTTSSWRESNCFAQTRQLQHARCAPYCRSYIQLTGERHPVIDPGSTMCPISVWFSSHVSTNSSQYFFLSRFVIQDFYKLSYLRAETSVTGTCGLLVCFPVTVGVTVSILYLFICQKQLLASSYLSGRSVQTVLHRTDFCELSYLHCLHCSPQLFHLAALWHCSRQFIGRPADVL